MADENKIYKVVRRITDLCSSSKVITYTVVKEVDTMEKAKKILREDAINEFHSTDFGKLTQREMETLIENIYMHNNAFLATDSYSIEWFII